ncbi:MAG: iron chaperone [Bryobacteraceae bacterium]
MKARVPNAVDEYIGAQPEALRPKLQQVRAAIRKAVPEASEGIGYGMPGYKLNGKPLLYFAGFKQHYSLFAASGTFFASLEEELKDYEQRKGTVHFPLNKPVPVKLISRIAKLRAAGISAITKKEEPGQQKRARTSSR